MKYGSWSTLDCPTGGEEIVEKAHKWLEAECDKIGADVRKLVNPHDLGSYSSFEIDCDRYEELDNEGHGGYCDMQDSGETCGDCVEHDELVDKLNDLEDRYGKEFDDNL